MTSYKHWLSVCVVSLFGLSLIPLLWTYQWATMNNNAADLEHEEFIEATLISCAVLAAASLVAHVAAGRPSPLLSIARAGTTGAVVAVSVTAASALLLAIVLEWRVGAHEIDSSMFAAAYVAVVATGLALGIATAWLLDDAPNAARTVAAMAVVVALSFAAGLYMVEDAARFNECVVAIEFPLELNRGECSGY
jgi:hypothetical protein